MGPVPSCFTVRLDVQCDRYGRELNSQRTLSDTDDPVFRNKRGQLVRYVLILCFNFMFFNYCFLFSLFDTGGHQWEHTGITRCMCVSECISSFFDQSVYRIIWIRSVSFGSRCETKNV